MGTTAAPGPCYRTMSAPGTARKCAKVLISMAELRVGSPWSPVVPSGRGALSPARPDTGPGSRSFKLTGGVRNMSPGQGEGGV